MVVEIVMIFLLRSLACSRRDRHLLCNERNKFKIMMTSVGQERYIELSEHIRGELDIITEVQEVTVVVKSED